MSGNEPYGLTGKRDMLQRSMHRAPFVVEPSGGSASGCRDPRAKATQVDGF